MRSVPASKADSEVMQPITHYENFPVASWLCPPALRAPIAAIYHYARTADDLADEGDAHADQRLADLAEYRADLFAASAWAALDAQQRAAQPLTPSQRWPQVFGPLAAVMISHALPLNLLDDLLDAFAQDVRKTAKGEGYETQTELLDYCRRSANPVGRLLLHLYGVHHEAALRMSDDICTALQLINFWQDLSVDIPRGRHYLTQEARHQHGAPAADIVLQRLTPAVVALIAEQTALARTLMLRGAPLVHLVSGRAGWELRLVVQGGLRILDKVQAMQGHNLTHRPQLKAWDVPLMLGRALVM
jgi:squalene synthase HpnC